MLSRLQRDLPLDKQDQARIPYNLSSDIKLCSSAYEFVFAVGKTQLLDLRKVLYKHGKELITVIT